MASNKAQKYISRELLVESWIRDFGHLISLHEFLNKLHLQKNKIK